MPARPAKKGAPELEEEEGPASSAAVAVQSKEIERKDFISAFTVHDGKAKYLVVSNAVANRATMQINVARLRAICDRTLKTYEDNETLIPGVKELKTLTDTIARVEEMSDAAYADSKTARLGDSIERLIFAATRGAAAGASPLAGNAPDARLRRLTGIGLGKDKSKVIDIAPPAAK